MKKAVKWFLIILLSGIAGLALFLYLNPKKGLRVLLPDINSVEHISIALKQDTALIDASLNIENKGLFKLTIDSLAYRVCFDTATLLSGQRYVGIKLRSGRQDTLHLPLSLPFKRLTREIRSHQHQDSVSIPVEVRLVYSTVFGKAVLPYSRTLKIETPRPPEFEIERIEFLKREKKTGYFLIHVNMHNYGKIDLKVSDIHYTFSVPELFTAAGAAKEEIRVKPRSTIRSALPVTVEFKSVFKTLGRLIRKEEVEYQLRLSGMVQAGGADQKKIPVEIEKKGRTELRR